MNERIHDIVNTANFTGRWHGAGYWRSVRYYYIYRHLDPAVMAS